MAGPGRRRSSGVWAIMVHGRGATRQEGLRAVRTARELGMSSLLISYRNDGLAPVGAGRALRPGLHRVARRRGGHRLCAGAWCPGSGAFRLVHGRGHLPPDRRFVPATAT